MAEHNSNTTDPTTHWRGRLPIGLVVAMIALGGSLGVMVILWNLRWPSNVPLILIVHTNAALCLAWGIVTHAISRLCTRFAATRIGHDLLAVIQTVQTTFALLVVILILYVAMAAVFMRVPSLPFFKYEAIIHVFVWPSGLMDLALVGAAILLAWWRTGNSVLLTCMLWLGVLASLWAGLQIPDTAVRMVNGIAREVWVDWVSPFVMGSAVILTVLTGLNEWLIHRRRAAAWPDRLNDLVTQPPAWPGFRYSAGIVAAMILVLGCMMIVSPLTVLSGILAGAAMLVLAHRKWEENFADAGFGLITLSVLSALMLDLPQYAAGKSEHFAALFSRAVLGLAIMTYFWHWLSIVWDQQLDQGRPWTTAGRLIRPCRRVGFIVAATGVLVSFQLAIWPILPYVDNPDNSPSRWVAGLLPSLLLIGGTTFAARKTHKPTLAWLALLAALATATFILVRIPGTTAYKVFLSHWPLVFAAIAGLCILLAFRCLRSIAFRSFFEPFYVTGILLLPMIAISGTSVLGSRAIPPWVDSATFLALAVAYLLAVITVGPRRLAVLAAVCAAAGVLTLRVF